MFEILVVAGILVSAFALFSFHHPLLRKLGGLAVLGATFLTGYFMSGRVWAGACAAAAWFLVPWLELLTRVRRLRLPLHKRIRHRHPPSRDHFPQLRVLSQEIEAAGFEYIDDTGWDWEDMSQFARVFYNPTTKSQATISLTEQGGAAFAYLAISSRTPERQTWTTWNYPFAPTMKFSPRLRVNRIPDAGSFDELQDAHNGFLHQNGLTLLDLEDQDPNAVRTQMETEIRDQIEHNLDRGVITLSGNGTFRYSWRGLFFLWVQFLKDMVRI